MFYFGFSPRKARTHPKPLGRRTPQSFDHILTHPLEIETVTTVNHVMSLPWWHPSHDQGQNGACVGHGIAMERAVREKFERKQAGVLPYTVRFNPWWFWDQAKLIDEWSDTNPGDDNGTSVHAGYDVVRTRGAVRLSSTVTEGDYPGPSALASLAPDHQWSITSNQWATSVDAMRSCIARDQPVTIGVNWYSNFDNPVQVPVVNHTEWYIGRGSDLGTIRGGHCVCIYGASDARQAFRVKNSWGQAYPLVWLPYTTMQRLLDEDGEAAVAFDLDT